MIEFIITAGLFIFGVAMIILVLVLLVPIIITTLTNVFSKDFLGYAVAMVVTFAMLGVVSWLVT